MAKSQRKQLLQVVNMNCIIQVSEAFIEVKTEK